MSDSFVLYNPLPSHPNELRVSKSGEFMIKGKRKTFGTRRSGGYLGITWGNTTVYAHRAVYEAWVGPIPKGMEIDHIDCDKTNNSLDNLRLVTKSGNMRNVLTRKANLKQLSTVRHKAVMSRVRQVIGTDATGKSTVYKSVTEAAKATGASRTDIARVVRGERHHAGGCTWRYHK